ncbi:MAG: hypothetical protein HWE20_02600 [Gammaproteobacteria bacterium]|nr:hypothetical protein [Gammaproteobacteria bacterium]
MIINHDFELYPILEISGDDDTDGVKHAEAAQWPPGLVSTLLGDEVRPQYLSHGPEAFQLVLRGINLADQGQPEDMVSVRLAWFQGQLVVVHRRHVKSLVETLQDTPAHPSEFALILATRMTDKIETFTFALDEEIEDAEQAMLADSDCKPDLGHYRRSVIKLRRYLLPQREILAHMARANDEVFDDRQRHQWHDLSQRTARVCELLDAFRERLILMQEAQAQAANDRLNRNLYRLSLISAVFLPLGFITGLLGINVGGIPLVDSPYGFAVIFGICAVFGVSIVAYFKHNRWF